MEISPSVTVRPAAVPVTAIFSPGSTTLSVSGAKRSVAVPDDSPAAMVMAGSDAGGV